MAVKIGQFFAIDLHVSGGGGFVSWFGSPNNAAYAFGSEYERQTPNHRWVNEGFDVGFRTFVTVPLPTPAYGAGALGAGLGLMRLIMRPARRGRAV